MNKRLLDICQQLPDVDVSEFQKFTSKWINYVKSNTAGDNIPETEWNHLFTRTNPVAGIVIPSGNHNHLTKLYHNLCGFS
jgi:hypothetical protein